MNERHPIRGPAQPGEEGYMLLAAMCLLVLFTISLSVAIPAITKEIQRDREVETIQRGKQYIRAIKMYYRKNGSYPPNIDALVKPSGPNNYRFLRKKYVDPLTGKEDWKPIHFGENKAPTAMGFFGQPLAGMGMGGVGPGVAGAQTLGSSLTPSSGFGSTDMSSTLGGSSTLSSSSPSDSSTAGIGGTSATPSATPGGSTTGSGAFGGQTFGGMGIIGFKPVSPKQAILIYKTKNHYNEWEFVYDPSADLNTMSAGGGPAGATPITGGTPGSGGLTGSGTGFGSSFGSSSGGSSFGSSSPSSFGSGSGSPTPPPGSNPNP